MRVLLDQGLPRTAAEFLRNADIDAVHAAECGLASAADDDILDYARHQDRIVVTLDADFHTSLALRQAVEPSVIRIRIECLRAKEVVDFILAALRHCRTELAAGAMVSVTSDRIRVRRLPV